MICIVQLPVTEGLSIGFFARVSLHAGFLAPIYLAILPTFFSQHLQEPGYYRAFLVFLLVNIAFLSLIAFSIVKNHRRLGGVTLFLFNFLSILFTYSLLTSTKS
jgi:hypothetical protein